MSNATTLVKARRTAGWKTMTTAGVVALGAVGIGAATVPAAQAYGTANVQVGVNTRDLPTTNSHSDGTVAGPGNVQSSSVKCYKDGQTVTGNYKTNRWFIVYVYVNGISKPQWEFVHASYVYNQPKVRECSAGTDY